MSFALVSYKTSCNPLTFVLLHLEEQLGVVEEVLAVFNSDLVGLSQLLQIELAFLPQLVHGSFVRKECYQESCFLLSLFHHCLGLFRVCPDQL